ncbi:MAG: hypothetical protein PHN77_22065 [Thermoguttaceae bacterium]|nr:hypothetical protein [Thermoguttaceae bacterium]
MLGDDERPADNIYGEQPYGDATGRRIAIRYYPAPGRPGGLNIFDLEDGSNHESLSGKPPFPADRPYTPRPTGHGAWIGQTGSIFFSTGWNATAKGNVWSGKVGDDKPALVHEGKRFGHVSVSRDGKYWIGDCGEEGVPIYIGSFATGRCKRACFSRTEYDGKQWSHAHPYLTADNKWLIFGARRNAHPQAYGAKLKKGWLDTL